MSIQSEITRIANAKSDIADAIEDKGVTVPSDAMIDDMPSYIAQIEQGGNDLVVTETIDQVHGGTIIEITGVDLSNDTVTASTLRSGYTAHDRSGTAITGTYSGADIPSGGTTGQVLTKSSATDYDIAWATPASGLPTVTTSDNGKVLKVASGAWTVNMDGMTILSYGSSTWDDFITAYNANKVVYCRASSNANPASGSQTRMAFMAYVSNATNPTSVEFQYVRSIATHSDAQQGDQVFVYKLDKSAGWTVTTREMSTKIVAGTGLGSSYSNGVLTLTNSQTGLPAVTASDNGKYLKVASGAWAATSELGVRVGSVTLAIADWTGNGPWEQEVTLTGETVTANTMVNLQASPSTIAQLQTNDITEIVAENDDGTVTIYCRGKRAPKANITLQYTLAETSNAGNVAILGNPITVGLLDFMEFDYNDGDLVPNATNVGDVSIMNGMISNGWVMMTLDFGPKVAFSSGTEYEIAELSTTLYNKVGRTWRSIGIVESYNNRIASVRVNTWSIDENDVPTKSIYFTPSTSYKASDWITFTIMFPVSYNI